MSRMFGGGQNTTMESGEKLGGLQIQTSSYGGTLALAYGTRRLTPNLIHHFNFQRHEHRSTQRTGKGGGGGSTQTTISYTYTASVMLALCAGTAMELLQVFRDREDPKSAAEAGFSLLNGSKPQGAWPALAAWKAGAESVGYSGTAIACKADLDCGTSGSIGNFNFSVRALLATIADPDPKANGAYDAHPADIVPHFLCDPQEGAGGQAGRMGDLSAYRAWCTAMGFFISPVFADQKPALEHLREILDATHAVPLYAAAPGGGMQLRVLPLGDETVSGNGATFTPDTTVVYDLGPDDFLDDDEPVRPERKSPADAFNSIGVKFTDRTLQYNENAVEVPEPADVAAFGLRRGEALDLPCITRPAHAATLSALKSQQSVAGKMTYRFRLQGCFALLEPGDFVTLTEPFLGLDHVLCRVDIVEEDEEGRLDVVAKEWLRGSGFTSGRTGQSTSGGGISTTRPAGNAAIPVIFEPPALATGGQPEVWLATAGISPDWGGCEVWISQDGGSSYEQAGSIQGGARYGVLSQALGAGPSAVARVDLGISKGLLTSATAQDASDLVSLCWVDGEMVGHAGATLVAANTYDLALPKRGGFGSKDLSHSGGLSFVRCDERLFRYRYPASRAGQTIKIKLVSFNTFGAGRQDMATVPVYTYTLAGTSQSYPAPTAPTLAMSDARPAAAPGQVFGATSRAEVDAAGTFTAGKFVSVGWSPAPSADGALQGYRVVLHTGADPDAASAVVAQFTCPPDATACVLSVATAQTVRASVQALYPGAMASAWATTPGSVSTSTTQVTIADDSKVVHKAGPETIDGAKTFTSAPTAPGYLVGGQQVLGSRQAGPSVATFGGISAGAVYTSSQLQAVSEAAKTTSASLASLVAALRAHGLIS